MKSIKLNSVPINVYGFLPGVGDVAPEFHLTDALFQRFTNADFKGRKVILCIIPSIECRVSKKVISMFSLMCKDISDLDLICVSNDLPFTISKYLESEKISNVIVGSAYLSPEFGFEYGVKMRDGLLAGLFASAIVCIECDGYVCYSELIADAMMEPIYHAAIISFCR